MEKSKDLKKVVKEKVQEKSENGKRDFRMGRKFVIKVRKY